MTFMTVARKTFQDGGHRFTAERRAVAELIEERDQWFTPSDLVRDAQARQPRVGRATVFRTLDLFGRLRLIERIDLPQGSQAYVACGPIRHHHIVCTACGRSAEVRAIDVESALTSVAAATGYRLVGHRLELHGLCSDCHSRVAIQSRSRRHPEQGDSV